MLGRELWLRTLLCTQCQQSFGQDFRMNLYINYVYILRPKLYSCLMFLEERCKYERCMWAFSQKLKVGLPKSMFLGNFLKD